MFKKGGRKEQGDAAEARALAHLQGQGLRLVQRNYRIARGPAAHGGEIDLVMHEPSSGTLVFVEVRQRSPGAPVSAAESVDARKQARLVRAARHFLRTLPTPPPCRFDVVAVEGEHLVWHRAAFEAPV